MAQSVVIGLLCSDCYSFLSHKRTLTLSKAYVQGSFCNNPTEEDGDPEYSQDEGPVESREGGAMVETWQVDPEGRQMELMEEENQVEPKSRSGDRGRAVTTSVRGGARVPEH
ncbi:hypothetical protein PO909_026900 [Leuciscus waleckii]